MNPFSSYEKMPDSLRKLGLDLADTKLLDTVDWVVTEKIHGANFSFILEDDVLRYAKRKEFLRWTDDFFGFQLVAERLDAAVMRLFERIRRDHAFHTATIYGELFGGHYPHPDVAPDARVQAIQTGIHYSPTVEYCAFDIAVEPAPGGAGRYYLDYAQAQSYFEECGFPYARPLLIGRLNQALFFNPRFDSRVPEWLGLPKIAPNLVEGIVLKPQRNIVVQTSKGEMRPILKIKNKEFAEEQFHESQAWSYVHTGASASERLLFLVPELRRFLTTQRLQNTISKIGTPNCAARWMEITMALAEDAREAFWEANAELLHDLPEADLDWLRERLRAMASAFVSQNNH